MIVSASLHQVASTGRRALQTPMETPCVVPANPGSPCLSSEKPATSSLSTQVCSCTHLNAGGLGSDVYQELTTYARDTRLDICHIQETEWPEDGCWSTADYHFVHSAGKNKLDKVGSSMSGILQERCPWTWLTFTSSHRTTNPKQLNTGISYYFSFNDAYLACRSVMRSSSLVILTVHPYAEGVEVELSMALGNLRAHKAVPAHLAPIAAWKLCSTELVPHLLRIAHRFTAAPDL